MFRIRFWPIFFVVALLPLFAVQPAHAMVYTITSGEDLVANNGVCSLREALINANNNNQSGSIDCPAGQADATDSIILLAGQTYTLTIVAPNNDLDTAAEGDLDILNNPAALDLQILSNGAERATIAFQQTNADNNRVLDIRGGATALLLRVNITGGDSPMNGGGIQNNGTMTLENSHVSDNRMSSGNANGGGIYTSPGSTLTIRGGSVVQNNISLGGGGGIYNDGGTVTIEASSVVENTSRHSGGGIASIGNNDNAAMLSITGSSAVSNNRAVDDTSDGGGVWNGNKSTTVIDQSLVEKNQSARNGGAIAGMSGGSVSVRQSTLDNNGTVYPSASTTSQGGAAWNAGTLTVEASTVSNSRAGKGGANSGGGAFYNTGTLLLFNSTVSANRTEPGTSGNGGAIASTKTLVVINSTISGNTASGRGGAIQMSGGYADIRHATITANTATIAHGGLYLVGPAPKVDIKHSIVAGNSAADCDNGFATLTSKGYNIVGDACGGAFSAATNDLVGVDAKLAALAANDGATQTHAPLVGSPALNAIPKAACADNDWPQLVTDQRGIARPQGPACEIGAYEQKPLGIVNPNPVPMLASLAPNTAPVGSSDFVMVVAGTKFVQGAVVRWNGTDRITTFVSAVELKAGITQADLVAAGTAEVTVFNPGPGGGSSNALTFVIAAPDKQNQTITFEPLADRTLAEGAFTLGATASSGLAVNYTVDGACAVSEGKLTLLQPGTCTITAGQAGSDTFNPAPDVARAFKVTGHLVYTSLIMRAP